MSRKPLPGHSETPLSPFDIEEEEEPWFAGRGDVLPAEAPPWMADLEPETVAPLDPLAFSADERESARMLADAAAALARLDEAAGFLPEALPRLGIETAASLTWATGTRISEDRLALYDVSRITRAGDDAQSFVAAHWAYRRLMGQGALDFETPEALLAFLGRHRGSTEAIAPDRPTGVEFDALAEEFARQVTVEFHPITRAAWALTVWRRLGLGDPLEGAVVAARLGAEGRNITWLPLERAMETESLDAWYRTLIDTADTARRHLYRLRDWRDAAEEAIQDMSGRTPKRLIAALLGHPALSAEMAASLTGASKPGIRRNLAIFEKRGLVDEITGQGRFRFWRVRR